LLRGFIDVPQFNIELSYKQYSTISEIDSVSHEGYYSGMNRVLILVTITCLTAVSHAATFLTLQFPTGISFDLPKNWVVLSKNKTITLDAYIEAVLPKANGDVKFQANLKNDYGQPIATVQVYYWSSQTSQSDVEDFTTFDVTEYNDAMQEQMQSQLRAIGSEVLSWGGTQKYSLGRLSVLTSEYVRPSSLIAGNFHVRVSRVYCGDNSISFVSSYHLGQPLSLRPIMDRVLASLKYSNC